MQGSFMLECCVLVEVMKSIYNGMNLDKYLEWTHFWSTGTKLVL